ncbi:MAG: flagellar basal-body rod protein FlgF [Gammaproteobacteria bacterium]|nr:flagellar basal-body rod protein FlgF [Gammaproteobacteria bacterium]
MDRMLYVAMSGAKETMLAQANNSNNLANANAPGFLSDLQQFRSMPVFGDGYPTRVYGLSERPATDFARGDQVHTGRDLDVAIAGEGWFAVQARDGSEAYSRRGDLKLDVNGLLTTGNGLPLLGNGGPIAVPPAEQLDIGPDGTISIVPLGQSAVEVAVIDRIKMVNPPNDQLVKGKDGLVRLKSGEPADADGELRLTSGAFEGSNVNIVNAMVDMIELSRRYEMQVKMMQTAKSIEESSTRIMRMG